MEKEEAPKASIDDYIIPQKIDAFVEMYKPIDKQMQTGEVFNDARLREFFKAVPVPGIGDPLKAYIQRLQDRGYTMHVSFQGEPSIFVKAKL